MPKGRKKKVKEAPKPKAPINKLNDINPNDPSIYDSKNPYGRK